MREINRIILHCSATPEGANFTAADIRSWHLARGWSDIGYHYVIGIDGTVESGRCISKQGAHTKGHNKDSIGICYIGGVDSDRKPINTLTWDQRVSIKQLCRSLRRVLNKPLYLHGHNEFSSKACPSFAVADEFDRLQRWLASPRQIF